MNKTSVLHAPSWAHAGEFIAGSTIYQFQACVDSTTDTTSATGQTYVQNVHRLRPVNTAANAQDNTAIMYLAYKWPMEDDYYERNGLSAEYITAGEGVIGLKFIPGVRIQEYVGTDYTSAAGVKMGLMAPGITWSSVSQGALLYFTNSGQLTTATDNVVPRAQFIESKGSWVTIELIGAPYPY